METSGFRPESHVAQQSRRDKLRVQQQVALTPYQQNPDNFPNNLEQFNDQMGINPDMVQVRSVRNANWLYEPIVFSSEMLDFSKNGNTSSVAQSQMGNGVSSFSKSGGEPQSLGNWRSVGPQQHNFDWGFNEVSDINQNPVFVRDASSNISATSHHHLQSTNLTNPSTEQLSCRTQIDPKLGSTIHFSSLPLYHNTLEDVVKASTVNQAIQASSLETQQNLRENGYGSWMDRTVENQHKYWSGELGYNNGRNKSGEELEELRNVVGECNPQGLCLSLSSNPSSKLPVSNFEGCGSENLPPRNSNCVFKDYRDHSKATESDYLCSIPLKPSVINKSCGKSVQEIEGISANAFRNSGPLGPFTGYASILKSSKFLKPAQQLLEEFCFRNGSMPINMCDLSEGISSEEIGASASASASLSVSASPDVHVIESHVVSKGSNSRASSSPFYSSNEISGDCGVGSSSSEPFRPEFQQKKAKLLYMLEEVCRRYKQYNQQMQLVITPFESVAGLSSATPYISLALKTVSRHFQCLKNAISEQLIHIKRTVGEDLSSPTIGTSIIKGDIGAGRFKYIDQGFQKHKSGGVNVGFFEPQQHIWRPQRGLPERAVSILRAWLFEHFLHPYPTDADKHMLANQTGLSRNQVSNWFINARVRLWKPMVEEIHMLETKGSAEIEQNHSSHDNNNAAEGTNRPSNNNQTSTKHSLMQLESCAAGSSSGNRDVPSIDLQNPEKRVRLECQVPTGMSGDLAGFIPYHRNGFEVGGLGPVSLTLGLRHGVESVQQQQQQQMQQQEDQLRRQFGEQMIRDFAG